MNTMMQPPIAVIRDANLMRNITHIHQNAKLIVLKVNIGMDGNVLVHLTM